MHIHIASDHAGFGLKEVIQQHLELMGCTVTDHGAHTFTADDDYPDMVTPCAKAVAADPASFGIILGGSGQGEAMCANRISGIRAAVFYGPHPEYGYESVQLPREHNNANILSIGARFVTGTEAVEAVRIFLETPFSQDERHVRRIAKY